MPLSGLVDDYKYNSAGCFLTIVLCLKSVAGCC